ncbi:MAG: hypothetical protein EBT65_05935 [Actinobacteria bacterium]|nr:hypothetical protein [Actinomycetota bacterium]
MTDSTPSYQPLTRKALREQAEAIAARQAAEQGLSNQPQIVEPLKEQGVADIESAIKTVELDEDGNPLFKTSNALTGEFTGANLIIETPVDITQGGALITDAGELVSTGSIDISSLITPTGEIPIIAFADSSDADLDKDAQANYIPGIPPMRASGVIAKTSGQPGIPGGAHRGINPYMSIGLLTLAALLIAGGIALSVYFGLFN